MSRLSVWFHDRFAKPGETTATAVFLRLAGVAGQDIIDLAMTQVAGLDSLEGLAGIDKTKIVTAFVNQAIKDTGISVPQWATDWMIHEVLGLMRVKSNADGAAAPPVVPPTS